MSFLTRDQIDRLSTIKSDRARDALRRVWLNANARWARAQTDFKGA